MLKEFLESCRFYHGEAESPDFGDFRSVLWDYEKVCAFEIEKCDNGNDSELLENSMSDYCGSGLRDFRINDGVSIYLKSILYNRYLHWGEVCSSPEGFMRWYSELYSQYFTKSSNLDKR